jgi:hypothetical protein
MALSRMFANMWNDPWEGDIPSRLYNQYFGSIVPDDFFRGVGGVHQHGRAALQA